MVKHECEKCKRAKDRIAAILRMDGEYNSVTTDDELKDKKGRIIPKFPAQKISEFLPAKDFYPDVYAERTVVVERYSPENLTMGDDGKIIKQIVWYGPPQPVIIEVDHHHLSEAQAIKDKNRDKHFLSKGIPTVRFALQRIIGSKKKEYDDFNIRRAIEDEMHWQLETQQRISNLAK